MKNVLTQLGELMIRQVVDPRYNQVNSFDFEISDHPENEKLKNLRIRWAVGNRESQTISVLKDGVKTVTLNGLRTWSGYLPGPVKVKVALDGDKVFVLWDDTDNPGKTYIAMRQFV
jgi:hypothetical protein